MSYAALVDRARCRDSPKPPVTLDCKAVVGALDIRRRGAVAKAGKAKGEGKGCLEPAAKTGKADA